MQIKITRKCKQPVSLRTEQFRLVKNLRHWKNDPENSILGGGALIVGGFVKSDPAKKFPDIQHHFCPIEVIDHARKPSLVHAFSRYINNEVNIL